MTSSNLNSREVPEGKDVEVATEEALTVGKSEAPVNTRRIWYIVAGIIAGMAIISVAIAVPIVVKRSEETCCIEGKQNKTDPTSPLDGNKTIESKQNTTNSTDPLNGFKNQNVAEISGYFNATLSLFGDGIPRAYSNESEFQQDVANVARFLLEGVVRRNTGAPGFENVARGGFFRQQPVFGVPENAPDDSPEGGEGMVAKSPGATYEGVDDYETNNQEKDIEEGDVMVSDGETGMRL